MKGLKGLYHHIHSHDHYVQLGLYNFLERAERDILLFDTVILFV